MTFDRAASSAEAGWRASSARCYAADAHLETRHRFPPIAKRRDEAFPAQLDVLIALADLRRMGLDALMNIQGVHT